VILNLALWFAIHTLFTSVREVTVGNGSVPVPVWSSVDWFAVLIAAIAFVGLWRFRWNVLWVVAGSAVAGLIYSSVH
jgi:chromate transporter